MILACTETSSADVGSSRITNDGSVASARAIAMICFSPPLSICGYLYMESGGRSTSSSSRTVSSSRLTAGRCRRSGRSRICLMLLRGLSDEPGSWKTIWIAFRSGMGRSAAANRSWPWK